jgi:hypothetical protein
MSDPSPNGQTWVCGWTDVGANCLAGDPCDPETCGYRPVPPAPSSDERAPFADLTDEEFAVFAEGAGFDPALSGDTPSDERHPGYPHQPGEPLTLDLTVDLARPAPSPVPEASGRGEVVQPTMHILRRADGEEMGEFAFWATDGPDGWDMAEDNDHDEDTVYEILACYPVARRKILWSTLCETCDGEGDGCPACAGSGECEPPDAEHMPIIARPAPSSSPVGDRVPAVHLLLDIWQALGGDSEAFHPWWAADPSFPDRWAQIVAAVAGNISGLAADTNPPAGALLDIAIQFGAADQGEPTDA